MGRRLGCLFVLAILAAAFFVGRDYVSRHPQDVPWTRLDLGDPVGLFTAGKIAGLGNELAQCQALLAGAGTGDVAAPERSAEQACGYKDGMRLASAADGRSLTYRPSPLVTSCPVAAALHVWETRVVQPAARRRFGTAVARIHHAGSYSCRRVYGRDVGEFSEHATADAVDIVGFELANGESVGILEDWSNGGAKGQFLRDVRDGGCRLFSTVLSPEYNEAHRDHLHLDVADRGVGPWTVCR